MFSGGERLAVCFLFVHVTLWCVFFKQRSSVSNVVVFSLCLKGREVYMYICKYWLSSIIVIDMGPNL